MKYAPQFMRGPQSLRRIQQRTGVVRVYKGAEEKRLIEAAIQHAQQCTLSKLYEKAAKIQAEASLEYERAVADYTIAYQEFMQQPWWHRIIVPSPPKPKDRTLQVKKSHDRILRQIEGQVVEASLACTQANEDPHTFMFVDTCQLVTKLVRLYQASLR